VRDTGIWVLAALRLKKLAALRLKKGVLFPDIEMRSPMTKQIDNITWHEKHQRVEVTYADGTPFLIVADRLVAITLAQEAGLVPVPAPPGIVRWARSPDSDSLIPHTAA